jgi:hypothetical protein
MLKDEWEELDRKVDIALAAAASFGEPIERSQIGLGSAWRCRARGTPDWEQAPLHREFLLRAASASTPALGPFLRVGDPGWCRKCVALLVDL